MQYCEFLLDIVPNLAETTAIVTSLVNEQWCDKMAKLNPDINKRDCLLSM